jgi:hypothetical protein|tara:strand:+ start:1118 stop:1378 length:261 start_codon:yes stop_codon:yes gene_type:complete
LPEQAHMAKNQHIDKKFIVGDILVDELNDEIGVLIRTYTLFDTLTVWDVHWTKTNFVFNDDKIHHYTEEGLQILIDEGTLILHPST